MDTINNKSTERRFAARLLKWYARHGRDNLPWRGADAYRVWLSEIMLQQTQVATVIPYYRNFLARFPDIATLAAADTDAVLHCWSGLGYYARARNLQAAARMIVEQHSGKFPTRFEDALALPGIGRSTAGAILAFAYQQRHPILDGNVRRVLSRVFAVGADGEVSEHSYSVQDKKPSSAKMETRLWEIAERLTPKTPARVADYNQAIMDFGATLCKRSKPLCTECPLASDCQALALGDPTAFPPRKVKPARPLKTVTMLIIKNHADELLLVKRPPLGIWGGLWSLPELDDGARTDHSDYAQWCEQQFGIVLKRNAPRAQPKMKIIKHSFTHFDLNIKPVMVYASKTLPRVMDSDKCLWYNPNAPAQIGLPTAVKKVIKQNILSETK